MIPFNEVPRLPFKSLPMRGIREDVAQTYGVRCEVDPETGQAAAYYFPLYHKGKLVSYQRKVARKPGARQKGDVVWVKAGPEKVEYDPFGSHVSSGGSRMAIVTEGAEDCLAAVTMLAKKGKNYRVISTLGTYGWKTNLEYFEQFEKVVIAYDQDSAGKQCAAEFAAALTPGKAVVMRWEGASDPNALLAAKDGADRFFDAIHRARPYQPDGIVYGEEVWHRMENYTEPAFIPYPSEWVLLNEKVGGIREAEITMLTGGTSVGKTAYTRRIKHHILTTTDWPIGEVELEERGEKTWRGLMECELGQPWKQATLEERRAAFSATYGSNRIFTLDHRSQYGRGQSLVAKFKHLHYAMGCRVLFLDHVTLAVNEFGDGQGNSAQDQMMNEFLELVEATGVHLFLLAHLRKSTTGGKSFEEGAVPSMDDLKGSGSLKQVAFNVIGVSRNLQHEDNYERNVSQMHALKVRETGRTGRCDRLYWDDDCRGLVPARDPVDEGAAPADREF